MGLIKQNDVICNQGHIIGYHVSILGPRLSDNAVFIKQSITRANSKGDSMHPCLSPVTINHSPIAPSHLTQLCPSYRFSIITAWYKFDIVCFSYCRSGRLIFRRRGTTPLIYTLAILVLKVVFGKVNLHSCCVPIFQSLASTVDEKSKVHTIIEVLP